MLDTNSQYLLSKVEKLIKEEAFILFVSGDLRIEEDGDEFVRVMVFDTTRILIEPELVRFETTGGLTILYYDLKAYEVLYSGLDEEEIFKIIKQKIKEILSEVENEGSNR